MKYGKPIIKRRWTSITAEQNKALEAECARRGKSEKAVFDEIVDAGFEAYFNGKKKHDGVSPVAPQQDVARAMLVSSLWSDYVTLDFLRLIVRLLDVDPDDPSYQSGGMSRYIVRHGIGELDRIWTGVGKRLEEGYEFNPALRIALAEAGADYDSFCGIASSPPPASSM